MRPHGKARVSARSPQAFGVCDRCKFLYNHTDLSWQFDWQGSSLINQRVLVCRRCMDVPQPQKRAIIIPADPVPVQNPRPENYVAAESNFRVTSGQNTVDFWTGIPIPGGDTRTTEDDNTRVTQTVGPPANIDPNVPGADNPGLPYGFIVVPEI